MKNNSFIFHLIILILFMNPLQARCQGWDWAISTPCASSPVPLQYIDFYAESMFEPNSIYIGGYYSGTPMCMGSYFFLMNGDKLMVIAKYDSSGNVIWAKASSYCWANLINIATDQVGNVYAFGTFNSDSMGFDTKTVYQVGEYANFFVLKLDSSGNVKWMESGSDIADFSGSGGLTETNCTGGIVTDAAGNIYIAGSFDDTTTHIGPYTLTNHTTDGNYDMFVAKYDSLGNVLWAKSFGGTQTEYLTGMSYANNSIYFTGAFLSPAISFGGTTLTNSGGSYPLYNSFITKMDTAGNCRWAKCSAGTGHSEPFTIYAGPDNAVYIGGMVYGTSSFGTDSVTGDHKSFIAKYDSAGSFYWVYTHPSSGSVQQLFYSITEDVYNNVWTTLGLNEDGVYLTEDSLKIFKMNSSGTMLDSLYFPSTGDDNSTLTWDNYRYLYFISDFTRDTLLVGADTLLLGARTENLVLAKYEPYHPVVAESITGVAATDKFTLFPNPADNECHVRFPGFSSCGPILEIYDVLGRKVQSVPITGVSTVFSTSGLSQGLYQCLLVDNETKSGSKRLIIMKY